MKKRTIKIICIAAGAIAVVGSGIAVLTCCKTKPKNCCRRSS